MYSNFAPNIVAGETTEMLGTMFDNEILLGTGCGLGAQHGVVYTVGYLETAGHMLRESHMRSTNKLSLHCLLSLNVVFYHYFEVVFYIELWFMFLLMCILFFF